MIQVPEVLEQDLLVISSSAEYLEQELPGYTPEQIWIGFERCGYDPQPVPQYIKSGGNLEVLPFHLKTKDWNEISPCRQSAIRVMYYNPNAFFYRNRPPGEEPMFGPWSEEEEIAFHDRLQLFKAFGIAEKHWGIFAATQKRFGYTCASHYKKDYDPLRFKDRPKPEIPNIPKDQILEYLRKEAFDIVVACIKNAGQSKAQIISRSTNQTIPSKPKIRNRTEKLEITSNILLEDDDPIISRRQYQEKQLNKTQEVISEPSADMNLGILSSCSSDTPKNEKEQKSINLALGAKDMVTGLPMRTPMVNRDGFVLDKNTWLQIVTGRIKCPFDITTLSIDDLTEVTNENFDRLSPYIMNIVF